MERAAEQLLELDFQEDTPQMAAISSKEHNLGSEQRFLPASWYLSSHGDNRAPVTTGSEAWSQFQALRAQAGEGSLP